MKKINQKHFRKLISIVAVLLLGIAIFTMVYLHNHSPKVYPVYSNITNTTVLPFDMGFHFQSVAMFFAMVVTVVVVYAFVMFNKNYRIMILNVLLVLFNIVGYDHIFSSSMFKIYSLIHKSHDMDMLSFSRVSDYITFALYAILALNIIFIMVDSLGKSLKRDSSKKRNVFLISEGVLLGLILIARTFTNPWYLVECVITFCLTFFIMNVMERVWGNTGYDYFWSNKSFFNVSA